MTGKYGFEVVFNEAIPAKGRWPASPESWTVQLPHQCESWEVTREDATKEQAIEDLEAFIAEARQALETLRSK